MSMRRVLAHITLYNSPESAVLSVESLHAQELGSEIALDILVSDNNSSNATLSLLKSRFSQTIHFQQHAENLGFAGAQNFAAFFCMQNNYDYLLLLNPDARLDSRAVVELVRAIESDHAVIGATPLLYRGDQNLEPLNPLIIDAAGMEVTRTLRHFDRQINPGSQEYVFGGTGAALLLKTRYFSTVALDTPDKNSTLYDLYPQLKTNYQARIQLFDEAFFAYREDADFAWRAQLLGFKFLFVPTAIGYHQRHVLPERRATLSPLINRWGVRNRFLMQLNNFSFQAQRNCILSGIIIRNLIVIGGVLCGEWSSLAALKEVYLLIPRALARRRLLQAKKEYRADNAARWFT